MTETLDRALYRAADAEAEQLRAELAAARQDVVRLAEALDEVVTFITGKSGSMNLGKARAALDAHNAR